MNKLVCVFMLKELMLKLSLINISCVKSWNIIKYEKFYIGTYITFLCE